MSGAGGTFFPPFSPGEEGAATAVAIAVFPHHAFIGRNGKLVIVDHRHDDFILFLFVGLDDTRRHGLLRGSSIPVTISQGAGATSADDVGPPRAQGIPEALTRKRIYWIFFSADWPESRAHLRSLIIFIERVDPSKHRFNSRLPLTKMVETMKFQTPFPGWIAPHATLELKFQR